MKKKGLLKWTWTGVLVTVAMGWVQGVFSQDTLYSPTDPVVQLTTADFSATVLGSRQAWAVEFYSVWCGHCQKFAPIWVEFAQSVKGWDSEVRVAAIACSDPKNGPVCRHNNIWGYPTIKFFPKNASQYHKGNPYKGHSSAHDLRNAMMDYVSVSRDQPRMKIDAVRSLSDARSQKRPSTQSMFLIAVETTTAGKHMAQRAVLDMSSYYPQVVVVWATADLLRNHPVTDYPAVYRLTDTTIEKIESEGEIVSIMTRESLRTSTTMGVSSTTVTTTAGPTHTASTTDRPSTTTPYTAPSAVHSQDLDSSVYYSFWVEVAAQKRISTAALPALKAHVASMAKYYPGSRHVLNFLKRAHHWLKSVKGPITGKEWLANITNLQSEEAYVPQTTQWIGCKGSAKKYRGYPCSLWMTFHALTVNAYLADEKGNGNYTKQVLKSMVNYINYFFGCRHCAQHFVTMAADLDQDVSGESEDAVLWLWEAHNSVNRRLHGDITEDPAHPKIQFPSPKVCTQCRLSIGGKYNPNVTWDDMQVLSYLVTFYRKENIILDPATKFQKTKEVKKCSKIFGKWSSCSQTCGTGVSSRLSNENSECEMALEFRLCQIRPCNMQIRPRGNTPKVPDTGASTVRVRNETRLTYKNCRSVKGYKWHYCGLIDNKYCRPANESTISVTMKCRVRRKWYRIKMDVMNINDCTCDNKR